MTFTFGGARRRLAAALAVLGLASSVGVLATAPPASAVGDISFDGESGTMAGVTWHEGATVSTAAARHGARGLAITAEGSRGFARWNTDVVPQGHTHASVTFWVRLLHRAPGESVDLFSIQNERRIENFDIFVNGANGRLQWDLFRENWDGLDTAMELNRWYLVEAQVEFAEPNYTARVRVDGVDQGTISSAYPGTTVRAAWVGAELNKTHTQHYDDIAMQVGDAPMGWLTRTPPSVTVSSPAQGATYGRGEVVTADYACAGHDFAVTSCTGTVADGAAVNTSTLGTKTFTVTATDTAGHTTTASRSYTVVDETPPTATITTPAATATYPRGATVLADYACADEPGGSGLASCVGPVADGAPLNTTTLGTHSFTVTATDNRGNSTPVTRTYRVVDATNPGVDLRTPAQGGSYARGATVPADFSCADDVGLASCVGTVADGAAINTSTLGPKTFTVTATDQAGNQQTVTHTYVVTDAVDPVVELRRPVQGATYGRGEVVEADYACADEHGGSGLASCVGPVPSGGAIDTSSVGTHEFSVTARDGAGNTTTVTRTYTVVDRTSPSVVINAPIDGGTYARGASVPADYRCVDEVGGSGLRPFGSCIGPVAIGDPVDTWTLGARSFRVTATDGAGNVGQTVAGYTVVQNQPDAHIKAASERRFRGNDVYGLGGGRQQVHARVARQQPAVFVIRVQNDTTVTDRFRVRAAVPRRGPWLVTVRANGRDVTRAVSRGTFTTGRLAPGASRNLQLIVRPTAWAPSGRRLVVPVTTSAVAPRPVRDRVRAVVHVR